MKQSGNVLLGVALVLFLIVVGMLVAANQGGVDILAKIANTGKQCVEVLYNSGVREVICH